MTHSKISVTVTPFERVRLMTHVTNRAIKIEHLKRRRISFCISNSDDENDFEDDPILKLEPFHDSEVFIDQSHQILQKRYLTPNTASRLPESGTSI